MKVLVVDTETNGLPEKENNNSPSIYNLKKWPNILQLSFLLYDTSNNKLLILEDNLIKIESSINISEESTKINGITKTQCMRKGKDIRDLLLSFNNILNKCDIIVGHNISFDKRILLVEFIRLGISSNFSNKLTFCTMKNSADICKIKKINIKTNEEYNKYPTLLELHNFLFDNSPSGLHNSLVDILITLRCYCKLKNLTDPFNNKNINNLFKINNIYFSN